MEDKLKRETYRLELEQNVVELLKKQKSQPIRAEIRENHAIDQTYRHGSNENLSTPSTDRSIYELYNRRSSISVTSFASNNDYDRLPYIPALAFGSEYGTVNPYDKDALSNYSQSKKSYGSFESNKTKGSKQSAESLRKKVKAQCKLYEQVHAPLKKVTNVGQVDSSKQDSKKITSQLDKKYNEYNFNERYRDEMKPHKSQEQLKIEKSRVTAQFPESAPARATEFLRTQIQSPPGTPAIATDLASNSATSSSRVTVIAARTASPPPTRTVVTVPSPKTTASAADIFHAKYIEPVIQKMNKIHLKNLKQEIALLEELESLSDKVDGPYQPN